MSIQFYATGVVEIDQEHREIIDMISEVSHHVAGEHSREDVIDLLGVIRAGIAKHFAEEEAHMQTVGAPRFRDHKADHDALLIEIAQIMADYEAGRYEASPDMLANRLELWFSVHFKEYDADLGQTPSRAVA